MDEDILEYVGQHDQLYEVLADDEDEFQLAASFDLKRPATGNEDDDSILVCLYLFVSYCCCYSSCPNLQSDNSK